MSDPTASGPRPMSQAKLDNYNSPRGATAYKSDYERKLHRKVSDRWERQIFTRFFAVVGPVRSILDLPCGAGRLYPLFQDHAATVIEGDWSWSMLKLNRDDHSAGARGYVRATGLAIPLRDRAVDMVVSVRLSHHLEREPDREQHLRELCRVADKAVILTFFSHWSLKNVLRRLRSPFNRKQPKNTLRSTQVRRVAAECGFAVQALVPLSRIGSGHVFALLQRRPV